MVGGEKLTWNENVQITSRRDVGRASRMTVWSFVRMAVPIRHSSFAQCTRLCKRICISAGKNPTVKRRRATVARARALRPPRPRRACAWRHVSWRHALGRARARAEVHRPNCTKLRLNRNILYSSCPIRQLHCRLDETPFLDWALRELLVWKWRCDVAVCSHV